jgi:hypothetical protein
MARTKQTARMSSGGTYAITQTERYNRWVRAATSDAAFTFLCILKHHPKSVGLWDSLPRVLVKSIVRRHIYDSASDVMWSLRWQIQEQERKMVEDMAKLDHVESELVGLRLQRQKSIGVHQEQIAKLAHQIESLRHAVNNNKRERVEGDGNDEEKDNR